MKTIQDVQFLYDGHTGQFTYFAGGTVPPPTTEGNSSREIITVPAGTSATHQTASGPDEKYNFVNSFDWAPEYMKHDLVYHGADVPAEFVK